jgi:hypothetical protein
MDGSMKALKELDFLGRKKPFTVSGSMLNLVSIIGKTTEGSVGEILNKERSRFNQILSRDVGEVMYLIESKKNKLRSVYA